SSGALEPFVGFASTCSASARSTALSSSVGSFGFAAPSTIASASSMSSAPSSCVGSFFAAAGGGGGTLRDAPGGGGGTLRAPGGGGGGAATAGIPSIVPMRPAGG